MSGLQDSMLAKRNPGIAAVSRRVFIQGLCATSLVGILRAQTGTAADVYFTIVNHVHQAGVGWYFREGTVGDKHYRSAYSVFYSVQKTIDAVETFPSLNMCLEFDSHAYEAMQQEDREWVQEKFRPLVTTGRIDLVGGTYSQPYASLIGLQSNIRQFVEGRRVIREVFGHETDCFLAEEIFFHPQVPQLLKLCGIKYASEQVQNNGSLPIIKKALVNWVGLDGTGIPTIPHNPWNIPLWNQYQPLDTFVDQAAKDQGALINIWSEAWPPGLDWGASFLPYAEGIRSLQAKGYQSLGLSEYMRRRCKPGTELPRQSFKMDDATLMFGWPQNKGLLWETIGGWGYEGDVLLKTQQALEHQLNATEQLLALKPTPERAERFRSLWKKLMLTQNHDCFIVSGYPGVYEEVATTNVEITKMMFREVEEGIRQLREEVCAGTSERSRAGSPNGILCQNPASVAVRGPVSFELDTSEGLEYSLESAQEKVPLQRVGADYRNAKPHLVGIVELPPCGFKFYNLKKKSGTPSSLQRDSGEIANEYYSIAWDEAKKGFLILDKPTGRSLLFRPFSGDITRVTESWWEAPNTGVKFRAEKFSEVPFTATVDAAGPVLQSLAVRGNVVTLSTTDDPAAAVKARATLYTGIPRVDIAAELHTYPRMKFLAFAECELDVNDTRAFRDFPFGEEESTEEEFSALNYVRLQSPGFAALLAPGGTQQFFWKKDSGRGLLRNTLAREVLKGPYRWAWSLTTGSSFSPADSHAFAAACRGPVVQSVSECALSPNSWVTVNDPAVVVFRVSAESQRMIVWLMNYSDAKKRGSLALGVPVRSCRRVDFEGKALDHVSATLDKAGKQVVLDFSPWEMAALELERA